MIREIPNPLPQGGHEGEENADVYSLVLKKLARDKDYLYAFFKHDRGSAQALGEEVVDTYELRPTKLSELTLPKSLDFVSGFSYVVGQWYPIVRAVGSGKVKPGEEQFMDSHLERTFRDRIITTQLIRESLTTDPSGATLLEEMATVEFRQGNLELLGARKAIIGVRKMYQQFASSRQN